MRLLFPLSFLVSCLAGADETAFTELILNTGKVYRNAVVTRTEPDAITVRHAAGIARIPFESLPHEVQDDYGFDPEAAARSRNEFLRNRQAQADALLAASVARAHAREQEKRAAENLSRSTPRTFVVVAVTPDGLLVNGYTPGYRTNRADAGKLPHGNPETGEVKPVRGDKVYLLRNCDAGVAVDGDILNVLCFLSEDTYRYQDFENRLATVRVYETTKVLSDSMAQ